MSNKINVGSLNVRGLGNLNKRKELFNFVKQQNLDIISLQETHFTKEDEKITENMWGGTIYNSYGSTQSAGVAILINSKCKIESKRIWGDEEGRCIVIELTVKERSILLVNVYGPNRDDPDFFINTINAISKTQISEVMVMGDFNVVLDPELDRKDKKNYTPKSQKSILEFMEEAELVDLWRIRNPDSKIYSWCRKKTNSIEIIGSRIDYVLMSMSMCNIVEDITYTYGYKTDHSLLKFILEIKDMPRGPGYWKFNKLLLYDKEFVEKANQMFENAENKYRLSTADIIWESTKEEVSGWAKKKSKQNAKQRNEKLKILINKYNECKSTAQTKSNLKTQTDLKNYQMQIEKLIEAKTKSAAFRSKARHIEDYEKNSKYFFSLEKRNYNKKTMSRIIENDKIVTDPAKILECQRRFYADLYRGDPNIKFALQNSKEFPILNDVEKQENDEMVSMEEITQAVKSLKREKCCGSDGLTTEFFQFFWSKMKNLYYNAIIYAKEKGRLHLAARRGVITLIPKKQNTLYLKGWRPLTMLSTCYKILAKVLAERMKKCFPKVISPSQTGFMEGRQISSTLRVTIDIAKYTKQKTGYILFLDFEKCFDRIEYNAIKGALNYLGFGREFINWCDLLMVDFSSATTNNGYFSDYFDVTRSCHQGCPAAPLFYLACGEVLAREITKNQNINGITINGLEHILAQFADDTQMFLSTKKGIIKATKTLAILEANTGLKVNYDKTCICTVNNAPKFDIDKPIVWDPGGVNVLGIEIRNSPIDNYRLLLQKSVQVMNQWQNRTLTLMGKILIINTLVSSLYVYVLQVELNPPKIFYREFEQAIQNYLWSRKKCKIPTKLLQASKTHAGQKLVDLEAKAKAIKIGWVFKQDPHTQNQLKQITPKHLGDKFWECALEGKDVDNHIQKTKINPFWAEVVTNWFELCKMHREQEQNRNVNRIIWFNSRVTINENPVFYPKAAEAGIMYYTDLYENNKLLSYTKICEKYKNSLDIMQYNALTTVVSKVFDVNMIEEIPLHQQLKRKKSQSNIAYNIFIQKHNDKIDQMYKNFIKKIPKVEYATCQKAFENLYKVTNITKYRDFQYRLLVNNIYTNERLYHWKIKNSKKCDFCIAENQSIVHLLIECPMAKKAWTEIREFITKCTEIDTAMLTFTNENIILNLVHPKAGHIVNFMVLVTKQYIFAQKCLEKSYNGKEIIEKIEGLYNVERYNAFKQNNVKKHIDKWKPYTGETEFESGEKPCIEKVVNNYIVNYLVAID